MCNIASSFTVYGILWSLGLLEHFCSWLGVLGVGIHDAGGFWVTEDEGPIAKRDVRNRLDLSKVVQDFPRVGLAFGFSFSWDYGSEAQEWKTITHATQLSIHMEETSK